MPVCRTRRTRTSSTPKKRELYEFVTDTGEVLSGSTSGLSIGKSQGALQTTELYSLNHGWNFGMFAEGKAPRAAAADMGLLPAPEVISDGRRGIKSLWPPGS